MGCSTRNCLSKLVANACATMDLVLDGETIPAEIVQKAFIAAMDGVFATVIQPDDQPVHRHMQGAGQNAGRTVPGGIKNVLGG